MHYVPFAIMEFQKKEKAHTIKVKIFLPWHKRIATKNWHQEWVFLSYFSWMSCIGKPGSYWISCLASCQLVVLGSKNLSFEEVLKLGDKRWCWDFGTISPIFRIYYFCSVPEALLIKQESSRKSLSPLSLSWFSVPFGALECIFPCLVNTATK